MRKFQGLVVSSMVLVMSALAIPAWACDAMGPNRHVGVVTQIDPKAKTFTIIDAQKQTPITFTASKKVLDALQLNRDFVITFRLDGRRMIAEAVVPAG